MNKIDTGLYWYFPKEGFQRGKSRESNIVFICEWEGQWYVEWVGISHELLLSEIDEVGVILEKIIVEEGLPFKKIQNSQQC